MKHLVLDNTLLQIEKMDQRIIWVDEMIEVKLQMVLDLVRMIIA